MPFYSSGMRGYLVGWEFGEGLEEAVEEDDEAGGGSAAEFGTLDAGEVLFVADDLEGRLEEYLH